MKKITLFYFLLTFGALQAQAVSGYDFSQAAEAYVAVSGTNSSATGDDGTENDIQIGFPFYFGGATYQTFSISTNGFIRLGTAIGGGSWVNALGNTAAQAPLIAAFWDDNNRNGGSIQYMTQGVAPNRTLEVGWNQVNIGNNGQPNNAVSASFKIRLHESGLIEIIYGPQMDWSGNMTASIGINDMTSFLSITPGLGGATASSTVANNTITSTADVVNNKYVFTPPPGCNGTPAPGDTIASAMSICSGHPLTLSLENNVNSPGISYQWQSSSDGVNFTDIDNATMPEIVVSQNGQTTYQAVVTCAFGESATSNPVTVLMSTVNCYCLPTYTFGKTDGDLISNIVITGTTLSNNTGTAPENPAYIYFTGQPNYTATLEAGTSYEIQVTAGSFGQQNSAVWIDFNDDSVFSTDERVGYTTTQTAAFGTAIYTIGLGCDAPAGLHRMRIRDVWNTAGIEIDPCDNYGYGETEDYDITIAAQSTCPIALELGTTTVAAYAAQLQWESACGQTSWDVFFTPAGGTPGTATHLNVSSPLVVDGLTPETAYDFYVLAHCDLTGDSVWAGPYSFVTMPEPVENDECPAAYSLTVGGTFDDYSLVATNAGATQSLGQPTPDCAAFNFGGDIWYSTTVPASGSLTIETRLETGSAIADTGLAVYSGDCTGLTSLGCSDDEGEGAFSKMVLSGLTPGTVIYARAWEYANDAIGAFRISAYDASLGHVSFDDPGFVFYPNPVKSTLNLSYIQNLTSVKVFNLLGQQIVTFTPSGSAAQLDLSSLRTGTYLVKISAGEKTKTIKIVKE